MVLTRYILKQFAFSVAIVLAMAALVFFITLVIFLDSITFHFYDKDHDYSATRYFRRDAFNVSYGTVQISEGQSIEEYKSMEFNSGSLHRSYGHWFVDMAQGKLYRSWEPPAYAGEDSTLVSAVAGIPGTLKLFLGGLVVSIVFTVLALAVASGRHGSRLRRLGRLLMKIGPAIPVFLIGAILLGMYQLGRIWPADPSPDSFLTLVLASLALGVIMAYGMIRILGPTVTNAMILPAADLPAGQSKPGAAKLWLRTGRIALLKLLASSPSWLLGLFAAIVVTEFIFDYSEGLGSMARFGGRGIPDVALNIGAVMLLTIGYASALFTRKRHPGHPGPDDPATGPRTGARGSRAPIRRARVAEARGRQIVAGVWTESQDRPDDPGCHTIPGGPGQLHSRARRGVESLRQFRASVQPATGMGRRRRVGQRARHGRSGS